MPKYKHSQEILDLAAPIFEDIEWFEPEEFKYPHLINKEALIRLDEFRGEYGRTITITDDGRLANDDPPGSAGSKSLHKITKTKKCQAFDIRIKHMTREDLYVFVQQFMLWTYGSRWGVELELVWSAKDKHCHIGFFLDETPSRLIIKAD